MNQSGHGSSIAPISVAVLVPCFNEALSIRQVVEGFRAVLPAALIYVYDNNSTDNTLSLAESAGAIVHIERRQGKGNVIRRMFADIDADCYVLVDGDNTYDPHAASKAVGLIAEAGYDFVNIARVATAIEAYRPGHQFGNRALTHLVGSFFGRDIADMLSGYKVMSRRFVKTFPAMSSGFETETELTVHALEMRMPVTEISAFYKARPSGSASKLRTVPDGIRIVRLISRLIKDERPFQFFGAVGLMFGAVGVLMGLPVVLTFFQTGLVPRLPTAVLSVGLAIIGCLSLLAGIILDVVTKSRQEMKRLAYLGFNAASRRRDRHPSQE